MRIPSKWFKQNDGLGKICDLQNCCPSVIRITQTLKKSAVVLAATVWWIASVILYSYLKPAYHFTNNVTSVSIIDCAGIFEFIKYFMFLTEILRLWCWRRQAEHLWALIYSSRWQIFEQCPSIRIRTLLKRFDRCRLHLPFCCNRSRKAPFKASSDYVLFCPLPLNFFEILSYGVPHYILCLILYFLSFLTAVLSRRY